MERCRTLTLVTMNQADIDDLREEIHRRVMWGDRDEDILHDLAAKGISEDYAKVLIEPEKQDRYKTIRAIYGPRIWKGIVLIFLGSLLFWFLKEHYFYRPRGIRRSFSVMSFLPLFYGIFQLLRGVYGVIFYKLITKPIADID